MTELGSPISRRPKREMLPLLDTPEIKRNMFPHERFSKFILQLLVGVD